MKVENDAVDPVGLVAIIILCGVVSLCLQGCGYALVRIPQPGERVSITTEQRVQSVYETALDVAEDQVNPVSRLRQVYERRR